jgi:hypothetical protein
VVLREPHEGFREVLVALWFVLIDEPVPEFHEANFTWGAVCKVFERFFVFDHEPVFRDFVFCLGEFFVWADFALASAAVKVAVDGGFEFSSLAKVRGALAVGGTLGRFRGLGRSLRMLVFRRLSVLIGNYVKKGLLGVRIPVL